MKADNRYVVPYNPRLLLEFDSHINVEMCGTVRAVKYIFKYVFKVCPQNILKIGSQGFDKAIVEMAQNCEIPDGSRTGQPPDMTMEGHLLVPSGVHFTTSEREVSGRKGDKNIYRGSRGRHARSWPSTTYHCKLQETSQL